MDIPEKYWIGIQKQFKLTGRELQICKLICKGFDDKEIAEELGIKLNTVQAHTKFLYVKMQVNRKIKILLTVFNSMGYEIKPHERLIS